MRTANRYIRTVSGDMRLAVATMGRVSANMQRASAWIGPGIRSMHKAFQHMHRDPANLSSANGNMRTPGAIMGRLSANMQRASAWIGPRIRSMHDAFGNMHIGPANMPSASGNMRPRCHAMRQVIGNMHRHVCDMRRVIHDVRSRRGNGAPPVHASRQLDGYWIASAAPLVNPARSSTGTRMTNEPNDDASRDAFLKAMEGRTSPSRRSRSANDRATRGLGLCVLVIGVFTFWFCTWVPLQGAAQHAARVDFDEKMLLFTPMLLGSGLLYAIMGASAWRVMGDGSKPSKLGAALTIAVIAAGFLLMIGMRTYLEAQGYVIERRSLSDLR